MRLPASYLELPFTSPQALPSVPEVKNYLIQIFLVSLAWLSLRNSVHRIGLNRISRLEDSENEISLRHSSRKLNRLSDNSISGQKHAKNKAYKAFKSKKKDFEY